MTRLVDGLGDVRWVSIGEIAASNAELHVRDAHAVVRPLSRRIAIRLPEATRTVTVEAPRDLLGDELIGWSFGGGPRRKFGELAAPPLGENHRIDVHGRDDVDASLVAQPPWRPWPKLRRMVVETRDRAQPISTLRGSPR
jgi:hypothetical protein